MLMSIVGIVILCVARASAELLVGINADNGHLVTFDSATPASITSQAVSGLPTGAELRGIDRRPLNGQIYGLVLLSGGTTCQLFTINVDSAVVAASGAAFACSSTVTDGDFDPKTDQFRFMSGTQNVHVNPDIGVATVDTSAAFAAGDLNAGAEPNVRAIAYTNNFHGASTTSLYAIESNEDVLALVATPNGGALNTVGGIGADVGDAVSFDVSPTGVAYFASAHSGALQLFTVNLANGALTLVGAIGTLLGTSSPPMPSNLRGLTTEPTPVTPMPATPMPPPEVVCAQPIIAPITVGCSAANTVALDIRDGASTDKAVCLTFAAPVHTQTNSPCQIVHTVLGGVFALLPEKPNLIQQYDSCTFVVDGTGAVIELDIQQGRSTADALILLGTGDCGTTQTLTIDDGSMARKRVSQVAFVTSILQVSAGASARADPHLVGANGVKFDFNGEANANYTLISTPQYEVTMRLHARGPMRRFMTHIGVMFRHETMLFSAGRFTPALIANLNRKLESEGGSASLHGNFRIRLELCPGHVVLLTQMHTAQAWIAELNNGHAINYLNVELIVPGCHDSFDGALGQTYKCMWEFGKQKFEFDRSTEESFRIPTLFTPTGRFSTDAKC